MAFKATLERPECNSIQATVVSVVCTAYTGGQPFKPCVMCEIGFSNWTQKVFIFGFMFHIDGCACEL